MAFQDAGGRQGLGQVVPAQPNTLSAMARQIFTALATLAGLFVLAWLATGCAKHADFLEMREELHAVVRAHNQAAKQQEALKQRLQSLESKEEAEPAASPAT